MTMGLQILPICNYYHSFPASPFCRHGRQSSGRRNLEVNASSEVQQVTQPTGTLCSVPVHRVTVHDRQRGVVHQFVVPEDQYILHTAESQNISLPFACRHGTTPLSNYSQVVELASELSRRNLASVPPLKKQVHLHDAMIVSVYYHRCCTSCAVRIKSGQIRQPEALGISAELRSKGYALLCVGFPSSDIEVETQDEDEVYWLQFGRYFARGPIERDDYALELAMGDE